MMAGIKKLSLIRIGQDIYNNPTEKLYDLFFNIFHS